MEISQTVTFNMTTPATSNTHSSRFLTHVLAIAIVLKLVATHREQDVQSDIKSQMPRMDSAWQLWAVKGQDEGVGLHFVFTPTHQA
ncbi:hypothetical protein PoB_000781100 [Plakobranchus ocellatus]|uniref:Uncharacterized protein n=1 Tax=Plakobranchus ocellatus TaxID=259542 RepID=A0AAV3Y261_9GAST|nr:hypothetical protein PoB_000781100 [Plakobranchus ocellatus]